MDLTTVKKKLNDYATVKEALDDLRLIWQNCFTFNVEGSEISNTALALGNELEILVEVQNRNEVELHSFSALLFVPFACTGEIRKSIGRQ